MASSLRNRVTSAPYRFPEQTASQYHAQCSASPSTPFKRAKSAQSHISPVDYVQFQKQSEVVQDEIWKSSCCKEKQQQVKWEKHWGFLTEYDQKGNPKEPKVLNRRKIFLLRDCAQHIQRTLRSENKICKYELYTETGTIES